MEESGKNRRSVRFYFAQISVFIVNLTTQEFKNNRQRFYWCLAKTFEAIDFSEKHSHTHTRASARVDNDWGQINVEKTHKIDKPKYNLKKKKGMEFAWLVRRD